MSNSAQTVAASLQAPTLFLIADDLSRMEIAANIDETDIGRIKTGQRATFTVNAFPGRTFDGVVKQVRLGSQNVQNVVIYTTIISIENPRRELLPGMTANLRVETERRDDVVRIPNAALRWRPPIACRAADRRRRAARRCRRRPQRRAGAAATPREFIDGDQDRDQASARISCARSTPRSPTCARASWPAREAAIPRERRERFRAARQELEQRIAGILTPDAEVRLRRDREAAGDRRGSARDPVRPGLHRWTQTASRRA